MPVVGLAVITDLVPGGAVYKLASDDRFVYGSGGGKLFALDPKTARKVNQRDLSCSALLIGPDGTLLASAAGAVQGIDTDTLATRWSIPFSQVENLKGFSRMILGPKKEIYGVGGQGIFRIDVAGSKLIQLTNIPSGNLAADSEGRLYFSKGANLYMVDPLAK